MKLFVALLLSVLPAFAQTETIDLFCEQVEPGVVNVHQNPIRYYDVQGVPQPIDNTLVEDVDGGWKNETNYLKTYVTKRGRVTYTRGVHSAWIEPRYISVDIVPEQNRVSQFERTLDVIKDNYKRARIADIAPAVDIAWEVEAGAIKEFIILKSATVLNGIPAQAAELHMAWDYSIPEQAQGSIVNNTVVLSTPKGKPVLQILPVVAEDSAGAKTTGDYSVRNGYLLSKLDLAWFRDPARVWPITIDPTVDSSTASAIRASTQDDGDTNLVAFKFPLPEMTGTVNAATINLYGNSIDYDANASISTKTSADVSWTTSSTAATLDALSMTTAIAAISAGSFTSGGFTSLSIYNTGTNSISDEYSVCNPGDFTVILDSSYTASGSSATTFTSGIEIWEDNQDWAAMFIGPTHANTAQRPYLQITYTGSLGCGSAAPPPSGGAKYLD